MINIKNRSLVSITDYNKDEILRILDIAEGFEKDQVEEILKLDTTEYQVSLVLPFGYRLNPQPKQQRKPIEEIVEFL